MLRVVWQAANSLRFVVCTENVLFGSVLDQESHHSNVAHFDAATRRAVALPSKPIRTVGVAAGNVKVALQSRIDRYVTSTTSRVCCCRHQRSTKSNRTAVPPSHWLSSTRIGGLYPSRSQILFGSAPRSRRIRTMFRQPDKIRIASSEFVTQTGDDQLDLTVVFSDARRRVRRHRRLIRVCPLIVLRDPLNYLNLILSWPQNRLIVNAKQNTI